MAVNNALPRTTQAVIARRAQLMGLLLLGCTSLALAADKVAELSDDFLEYLGSLEGADESWLDFTAAAVAARESAARPDTVVHTDTRTAASASSSSAASLNAQATADVKTNATSRATGEADK
ncbi:MAG: hypothetical protein AB7T07_07135 [Steroidobacteraceae bacterium]